MKNLRHHRPERQAPNDLLARSLDTCGDTPGRGDSTAGQRAGCDAGRPGRPQRAYWPLREAFLRRGCRGEARPGAGPRGAAPVSGVRGLAPVPSGEVFP